MTAARVLGALGAVVIGTGVGKFLDVLVQSRRQYKRERERR